MVTFSPFLVHMSRKKRFTRQEKVQRISDFIDQRFKIHHTKVNEILDDAQKFSILIYKKEGDKVEMKGNGMILAKLPDYYIISAGHLLNLLDCSDGLYAKLYGGIEIRLCGDLYSTNEQFDEKNKIDLAVLKLDMVICSILYHYKIHSLAFTGTKVNHQAIDDYNYSLIGYVPTIILNEQLPVDNIRRYPYSLMVCTSIEPDSYNQRGYNNKTNFLISARKKVGRFDSDGRQDLFKLNGVSGSGVWVIEWDKQTGNNVPKYKLVGLFTDDYLDKGFLASTRIDLFFYIIKNHFNNPDMHDPKIDYSEDLVNLKNLKLN